MGTNIDITASDGHKFAAYRADPTGKAKGAVVVVQEAFGVNAHIREMADRFAQEGYLAIAPALYDRVERGIDVGYTGADREKGIKTMQASNFDNTMKDVAATLDLCKQAGKVGITGWCWGGSVSWLAACRVEGFACSVPCYGGRIPDHYKEKPRCPVQFHWGETDASIPMEKVRMVEKEHPEIESHIYPAGHGFTCDHRDSYDEKSAKLAYKRTMEFFAKHIG
ncbi:MAG: dienelactone hydrolase family protein [Alphaproteobacteria bacterium]|nr:dienelactone hydrolase family protein [Alphaproteobacteria bacterium]